MISKRGDQSDFAKLLKEFKLYDQSVIHYIAKYFPPFTILIPSNQKSEKYRLNPAILPFKYISTNLLF